MHRGEHREGQPESGPEPAGPSAWQEAHGQWGPPAAESPWANQASASDPSDPWAGIEPVGEEGDGRGPASPAPGGLVFRLREEGNPPEPAAADEQQAKRRSLLGRLKG